MPALDQTQANGLLTALTGGTTWTKPAGSFLTVGTGTPTATSNMAESAVTRQAITWGTAASGSIANITSAITFTNMPAQTTTAVEVWSAVSAGSRVFWYAIPAGSGQKVTAAGDTLSFAVGAVVATLG